MAFELSIWLPILWMATGTCLFAAVHFLHAGQAQGNARLFRAFGVLSLMVAVYIGLGAVMQTPLQGAPWMLIERLHVSFACLTYVSGFWFIAMYSHLQAWRRWVCAAALVFGSLLLVNLIGPHGLLVSSLQPVAPLVLPWGERINQLANSPGPLAPLYYLATLGAFGWAFWRCHALWKHGETRRALPLAAFLVLQVIATGHSEYTMLHPQQRFDWDALPFLVLVLLLSRTLNLETRGYAAALDASNAALREENRLRSQAETRLRLMAFTDATSQLPNRHALLDKLGSILAGTPRPHGALVVIDPHRFAVINHALGHRTGDLLMRELGQRLSRTADGDAFVVRLSGDEFAVVFLVHAVNDEDALAHAVQKAESLREDLTRPLQVERHELSVNVHMGLAMFQQAGGDAGELLRQAYAALHAAKQTGNGRPATFVQTMQDQAERRLRLETDLHAAIDNRQLHLLYQPQVDRDDRLTGAEALLRWSHPVYGDIGPQEFVAIAEGSGQMPALGRLVMQMAFSTLAALPVREPFRLSVNVSPWQLFLVDFVDTVRAAIRETAVNPHRITLEITESTFIHDVPDVAAKLRALAALGIHVSIDDFGTGYASIALLKTFPVHELKIDQSFIRDMSIAPPDRFVAAVIALADAMGVRVVAEGVEHEPQLHALRDMGCHAFQGYLIGYPLMADELARLCDPCAARPPVRETAASPSPPRR